MTAQCAGSKGKAYRYIVRRRSTRTDKRAIARAAKLRARTVAAPLCRTEYDGRITTLIDRHAGKRLNSPNDVVVKSDGSIWFTDPLYGISNDYEGGRQASEQPPAVYRLEPETGDIKIIANDFDGPNGLAFSPDEKRLYIAETGNQTEPSPRQYIRVFNVEPDGATLSGGDISTGSNRDTAMVCALTSMATSGAVRPMVSTASVHGASCWGGYSSHTRSPT